jgi:hypothetical protein
MNDRQSIDFAVCHSTILFVRMPDCLVRTAIDLFLLMLTSSILSTFHIPIHPYSKAFVVSLGYLKPKITGKHHNLFF